MEILFFCFCEGGFWGEGRGEWDCGFLGLGGLVVRGVGVFGAVADFFEGGKVGRVGGLRNALVFFWGGSWWSGVEWSEVKGLWEGGKLEGEGIWGLRNCIGWRWWW